MSGREEFESRFEALCARFDGNVGFAFFNRSTNESFCFQENRLFSSASVIKLFVLGTLLERVQLGLSGLTDIIATDNPENVGGCGVLKAIPPGGSLRVEDVAVLMIIISDNVATNRLIDYVGGVEVVNAHIQNRGLEKTRLNRKVSGAVEPLPLGVTTPKETMEYLRQIDDARNRGVAEAIWYIKVLEQQIYTNFFLRNMPENRPALVTANKTGNVSGVRNDVGLLAENGHVCLFSAFTDECSDASHGWENTADIFLGELGALCLDTLFCDDKGR